MCYCYAEDATMEEQAEQKMDHVQCFATVHPNDFQRALHQHEVIEEQGEFYETLVYFDMVYVQYTDVSCDAPCSTHDGRVSAVWLL